MNILKKYTCLFVIVTALIIQISHSQTWENNLYDRIDAAPVNGGFEQKDYWVWGSSVVEGDDGLFHMFVSRWPKTLPFHPGWMVASEVIHAVSSTPEGPYEFKGVALGARGAQYWDGKSIHNPNLGNGGISPYWIPNKIASTAS